ncbi:MAG: hypothetical protein EOO77_30420 [Oxalobacteraceae bacterium]|nr:MAG: hypothetical protein EOO77_30420 [Oxalobacteraceae bacterium]
MGTDHILDVLGQHAFGSMVGQFSVVTFEDPRQGLVSFAFIGGLPIPYTAYLACLTGRLFQISPWIGVDWGTPNHLSYTVTLWARMKLPQSVFGCLEGGESPMAILDKLFGDMLKNRCTANHVDERRKLVSVLISTIEHEYADSLRRTIPVENIVALFAPIDLPWKDTYPTGPQQAKLSDY